MNSPNLRAIEEAAHSWRVRLNSSDISDADCRDFQAWLLADPRHRETYAKVSALWDAMGEVDRDDVPSYFFERSLREQIISAGRSIVAGVRRPTIGFGVVGASAAVLAIVLAIPSLQPFSPQIEPVIGTSEIALSTDVGEIKTETLADGSVITIGPKTSVNVTFHPDKRLVDIATGEAFFDVARDIDRPFIVSVDDAKVRVLGTSFDVRSRANVIRVGVAEGEVQVTYPVAIGGDNAAEDNDRGRSSFLSRQTIIAGQQVSASREAGLASPTEISIDDVGVWRERLLVYKGAMLSEIAADANRYGNRRVFVSNADVGRVRVTTAFMVDDLEQTLSMLAAAFDLVVEETPEGDVIISAREGNLPNP